MIRLFSKSSLMILESLSFTKTLYAFDFDGTLSKIVPVPTDAKLSSKTEHLLSELSKLVPVAIVSGRSIKDLKEKLSFQPQFLIGNHGLEGLQNNKYSLGKAQEDCLKWKIELEKMKFGAGVEIEDKIYSLAIHFRRSRNKKIIKKLIQDSIEKLDPIPRIVLGKSVVNLLPERAPHKGNAVLEIMRSADLKHAFYIGDDDTDEDVFGLANGQIVMTVRVGKKRKSQARYFIDRQSEINQILKLLIQYHQTHNQNRKGNLCQ